MMRGLLPLSPSGTMNATVPTGRPHGGSVTITQKKLPVPVPQRGLEAEVLHILYDFYDSGANSIGSCTVLKNQKNY
jgi:hypothetical protein